VAIHKECSAGFSHANIIDAPWAARSGEQNSAVHLQLGINASWQMWRRRLYLLRGARIQFSAALRRRAGHGPYFICRLMRRRPLLIKISYENLSGLLLYCAGNLVTGQNFNAARRVAELVIEEQSFGVRVTP